MLLDPILNSEHLYYYGLSLCIVQLTIVNFQINKERDNGVTAGIELVGSEDAQSAAQQMINDVVASSQSSGYGQCASVLIYGITSLHSISFRIKANVLI